MESDSLLLPVSHRDGRRDARCARRCWLGAAGAGLLAVALLAWAGGLPLRATGATSFGGGGNAGESGAGAAAWAGKAEVAGGDAERPGRPRVLPSLALHEDDALWEVAHAGPVEVSSGRSTASKVLGVEQRCAILVGTQEGPWVRLRRGGYVKILRDGVTSLRLLAARYETIEDGTCRAYGQFPIIDPVACQLAALSLRVSNTTMRRLADMSLPAGCYFSSGSELELSSNLDAPEGGDIGHRQAICSSWETCYPVTKTTTMTTTPTTTPTTTATTGASTTTRTTTGNTTRTTTRRTTRTTTRTTTKTTAERTTKTTTRTTAKTATKTARKTTTEAATETKTSTSAAEPAAARRFDIAVRDSAASKPTRCARSGESCIGSRCCFDPATRCFAKDEHFATCRTNCSRGVDPNDDFEFQTPWSCDRLGKAEGLPALYCFVYMLADSYEGRLMRTLYRANVSVFGCSSWAVYSNKRMRLDSGDGAAVETRLIHGDSHIKIGGIWATALNTEIFVRVWHAVLRDAQYWGADWTVKLDADAVILPRRLQEHLRTADSTLAAYLNNCKYGLHGPVEIVSKAGMAAFGKGIHECEEALKSEWKLFGEDVFFRHCLELLGVGRVDDFALLSEDHCDEKPYPCVSGKSVFHPFKDTKSYFECLTTATGEDSPHLPAPNWSHSYHRPRRIDVKKTKKGGLKEKAIPMKW